MEKEIETDDGRTLQDLENELKKLKERKATLDVRQNAIKVLMNSFYGAMSNEYFRFYDVRMAESITLSGQLLIRWAEVCVNAYLNRVLGTRDVDYVIAMDTDSLYVHMKPLIDEFCPDRDSDGIVETIDRICRERVKPMFVVAIVDALETMGARDNAALELEREKICDAAIWTGKKRYALHVLDDEGIRLKKPKVEIKGIECVRSSTPQAARDVVKEAIEYGFGCSEHDMKKFVAEKERWFRTLTPEELAFPKTVTDIESYADGDGYRKGCPIHVRASILYNAGLRKHGLTESYEAVRSGEKVKYVYLRTPNPFRENVVGFVDKLPEEFGLHGYVDKTTQWEKSLLGPIENVFGAAGWNVRDEAQLPI